MFIAKRCPADQPNGVPRRHVPKQRHVVSVERLVGNLLSSFLVAASMTGIPDTVASVDVVFIHPGQNNRIGPVRRRCPPGAGDADR